MVRSIWKKTLVTTLAWAGIAWAQQPLSSSLPAAQPVPATNTMTVVTVHEAGKPPQKCKVVKSWQTPEGAKTYQVQALDSGEMITIVESGPAQTLPGSRPGTRRQAMTMRIYHWGKSTTPPAGAPMPPVEIVQTMPTASEKPEPPSMPLTPAPRVTPRVCEKREPRSMPVTPAPQLTPQLSTKATLPSGSVPDPASLLVSPVPHKPQRSTSGAKAVGTPAKSPYAPTGSTSSVPGKTASMQTNQPQKPASDKGDSPYCQTKQGDAKKLMTNSTPPSPGVSPYASAPVVAPKKVTTSTSANTAVSGVANPPAAAAQPTDWRKSWGDPKTAAPVIASLPHADTKLPDPLQAPEKYVARLPLESRPTLPKVEVAKVTDDNLKKTSTWAASSTTDPSAQAVPTVKEPVVGTTVAVPLEESGLRSKLRNILHRDRGGETRVACPKCESVIVSKGSEQVTALEPGQEIPLGAQSVIAAGAPGNVQYIPVPVVTVPDVQRPPMPPMPVMPRPPQPTPDSSMVNALPPAGMQVPMAQGAVVMDHNATMSNPSMIASYNQGQEPSPQALQQMLAALRDSIYPSQREWAAESLATADWRNNPHIVQALVAAAKDDPAATVRAGCVRCLAKMNVNTAPVVTVIQALRTDPDPRVRQEVDIALDVLSPGHTSSAVQPAGVMMPLK